MRLTAGARGTNAALPGRGSILRPPGRARSDRRNPTHGPWRRDVHPNAPFAISPDDQWIATPAANRALTVYPVKKGEPVQISSVEANLSPHPAGWTRTGELWVVLPGATPPRLVRVEFPSGKITRSIDVDLRQLAGDEMHDARITPDESLLAVAYTAFRVRLELMKGIPADR